MAPPQLTDMSNPKRKISCIVLLLGCIAGVVTLIVLLASPSINGNSNASESSAGTLSLPIANNNDVGVESNNNTPTTPNIENSEVYDDPLSLELKNKSGPWEDCLDNSMTGEDCMALILLDSPDLERDVFIIWPNMQVTKDLRYDRVRIFVDDDGIVMAIPERG